MNALYQTGDKVQLANGGPVMEVIGYPEIDGKLIYTSIICQWFDLEEMIFIQQVYHQDELVMSTVSNFNRNDGLRIY